VSFLSLGKFIGNICQAVDYWKHQPSAVLLDNLGTAYRGVYVERKGAISGNNKTFTHLELQVYRHGWVCYSGTAPPLFFYEQPALEEARKL
jgi:hypothetical protein